MNERPAGTEARIFASLRRLGPLVDTFVDMVEPVVIRLSRTRRWSAVEVGDDDFAFYQTRGGRTVLLGNGSTLDETKRRALSRKKGDEVELRLLPERVVSTTIKVPAAGIAHVDQIVAHRLDRLTPWQPANLLYGFAQAARPGADGQVDVEFSATSREIAAGSIRRLDAFGIAPSRMGSASEPIATRLRIDLFQGKNDTARRTRRKRIAIVALTVPIACFLAFAVTSYLAVQARDRLADLDQRLASARRTLINGAGNAADRQIDLGLIAAKTPANAQFVLIDTLARIIPDNTVLDELDIQPASIRIAGTSTAASALIEILEAQPDLSDAAFAAAVTRQTDGRDRFDITAVRLIPAPEAAP